MDHYCVYTYQEKIHSTERNFIKVRHHDCLLKIASGLTVSEEIRKRHRFLSSYFCLILKDTCLTYYASKQISTYTCDPT